MRQRIYPGVFIIGLLLCSSTAALAAQSCQIASITASTPTAQFTVNGDGTVTDTKTGLMWKQCSEGLSDASCATGSIASYTWQGALQLTPATFATFSDWRVPNKIELASIVERQCVSPSINAAIFPATLSNNAYWSASPYAVIASFAWNVNFSNGVVDAALKTDSFPVRLVRGGQ